MPKIARCPTCHRRLTRNNDQNRRLWALYHAVADKLRPGKAAYSAEQWHMYFKSRFLGCDEVQLPSGKSLVVPRSTANLDIAEFSDYQTQVEAWANEHNVYLEDAPY